MARVLSLDDARSTPCGGCGHLAVYHVYSGEQAYQEVRAHMNVDECVKEMLDVMCCVHACHCPLDVLGAVFSRIRLEKEVPF